MLVYGDTVYTDKKPDGAPWKEYPPEHGLISLGLAHGASSRKVICDYTFTDLPKTAVFLGLDPLRSSTGANGIYIGVIGLDSGGISLGNGTAAGPGARQSCAVTSPKSALSTVYQITTIVATDWVCWQGGLKKSVSFSGSGGFYSAAGAQLHSGWNQGTPGAESNKLFFVLVSNSAIPSAAARALSDDPIGILFSEPSLPILVPSSASALSGSATGGATSGGSANLSAQVALAGVGVATAGGSAVGSVAVPLSATGLSVAGGSAAMTATVSISASGLAQAAGTAGLSAAVLLAGAGAAQASGNATLAAQLSAMASGAAQAGGSANLSGGAQGAISASGGAVSGGSAVLNVTVQIAATGGAVAGGSANLSGGPQGAIAASGVAVAGGSGTLSVTVALTAAGFAQAMGAGVLTVVMSTRTMAARHGGLLSADSFSRPQSLSTGRRSWR